MTALAWTSLAVVFACTAIPLADVLCLRHAKRSRATGESRPTSRCGRRSWSALRTAAPYASATSLRSLQALTYFRVLPSAPQTGSAHVLAHDASRNAHWFRNGVPDELEADSSGTFAIVIVARKALFEYDTIVTAGFAGDCCPSARPGNASITVGL